MYYYVYYRPDTTFHEYTLWSEKGFDTQKEVEAFCVASMSEFLGKPVKWYQIRANFMLVSFRFDVIKPYNLTTRTE